MAFAVGGSVHALAFALIGAGVYLYGEHYPAWRHPLMATIDAVIVWIGFRRPEWLPVALALWIAEQLLVNGVGPMLIAAGAAFVALLWERHVAGRH